MTFPTAVELAQNNAFARDVRKARELDIDLNQTSAYQDMAAYFRHMHEMDFSHSTMTAAATLIK